MSLVSQPERQTIKKKVMKINPIFKNPLTNIILFETLGSLILTYGICVTEYLHPISRRIPNPFWTFLISCFNFLAISIAAPFTGGQINPVATIGLCSAGLVEKKRLIPYIVSQLVGSILGTLIYYAFFQENPYIYEISPEFSEVALDCLSEAIGTFIFVFGVLQVTIRNYMKGETFQYFFISLMLLVARTFTFRKGCLNPAVAIALQIFTSASNQNFALFYSSFGLIVGQVIGAVCVALFYVRFYQPLVKQIEQNSQ